MCFYVTESQTSGRYDLQISSVPFSDLPNGYAEVICDTTFFYQYSGFVTLTIEDNKVVSMTGSQAALDAYLAEYPDAPPTPQPTETEKLRADVDYLAVMTGVTL